MSVRCVEKASPVGHWNGFHHHWCNSIEFVNETLQNFKIVLVSDPFTKDSEHPAVLSFACEVDVKFGRISPTASRQIWIQ